MVTNKKIDYQILNPVENDLKDLINLNTFYFAKTEQTNKVLNIPDNMYLNYAEYITKKALDSDQISIAKHNGNIIGFLIWEDYCKPLVEGITGNPDVYKIIAPELEFVELLEKELNKKYQFKEYECAKLMQAGVLPEYHNQGIATSLAEEAIANINRKGYKYIIADCTADNSWQVLLKLGFKILTEIAYSDFEHNGSKTFAVLEGKRRLVIKQL
ncbi:MAG: GNAT family N-acetyltransferase [Ignavibacteriae bacterium]|nr:GNAT family N-acetyltransferase [Ignavibacteriota bacterium]